MKNVLLKTLIVAFGLSAYAPLAFSHGSLEPEHGGIVKIEHELVFELVRGESNTSVYIKDHGKPVDTEKLTGSIMVLAAGKKSEAELSAAGGNKMTADIVLSDGDKVLVKVSDGKHHPVTVRYSL